MTITIRQLEIFAAVVETGHVTQASEKLYLTQSAVSMALNELQYQLGGPLFDKKGRKLQLNDRGRFLLPRCKKILNQISNIETLMGEKSENIVGYLEIVASSTIGNYVLPYLISAFMRMHPSAHINMLVCNTRHAMHLIVEGKMDLGFVEGEVNHEEIRAIPWFQDELEVITGPSSEIAGNSVFRVGDDMRKCKWIIREKGSGTAQIFKKKLGRHVTELNVVMELGHTEAIKKAVEFGSGVSCLSNLTFCREVEQGWLKSLRMEGLDMKRQLRIIHHKNKAMTKLMDEFISFCSVINECSNGCVCLSSPSKLQQMVDYYEKNSTFVA
ncbi:MAG: LysR family transcriptional regulator [Deltaproteobacteria bacterium]|nr:LysR family transcriptional regulator [Deltaproteobacteria bacterium]